MKLLTLNFSPKSFNPKGFHTLKKSSEKSFFCLLFSIFALPNKTTRMMNYFQIKLFKLSGDAYCIFHIAIYTADKQNHNVSFFSKLFSPKSRLAHLSHLQDGLQLASKDALILQGALCGWQSQIVSMVIHAARTNCLHFKG